VASNLDKLPLNVITATHENAPEGVASEQPPPSSLSLQKPRRHTKINGEVYNNVKENGLALRQYSSPYLKFLSGCRRFWLNK
jgi:hypothetical protein